jgi:RNA polymerase sigma-70 factor (ECF subfamily)
MVLERRVNDPELARDLYQETFAVVLLRLRQRGLDDPSRLTAFLQQTAANLAIGAFRKDSRRRTHADSDSIERVPDTADNPYQRVHRDELRRAVMRMISELDVGRDRELLLRHYVHDVDKSLLCRDYGLSAEHFDRVIFRARQRLKSLLNADGIDGVYS